MLRIHPTPSRKIADLASIDGRKPTCEACERRKQVCGGYRRGEFIFLNEGWRAPGVASNRIATTKNKRATPARETHQSGKLLAMQSSDDEVRLMGFEQLVVLPRAASFSKIHISAFLTSFGSRPSQKLGSLSYLFRQHLPSASISQYSPQKLQFNSITPVILAVDALVSCHFGMANADTALIQRGCEVYGRALQSMSAMLAGTDFADVDFQSISEEDWGQIAFFCLVMTFWEVSTRSPLSWHTMLCHGWNNHWLTKQMKMSAIARNWGGHVRCLAAAIAQRGNSHAYSESNFRLLASSRVLLVCHKRSLHELSLIDINSRHCKLYLREIPIPGSSVPRFGLRGPARWNQHCANPTPTRLIPSTTSCTTLSTRSWQTWEG